MGGWYGKLLLAVGFEMSNFFPLEPRVSINLIPGHLLDFLEGRSHSLSFDRLELKPRFLEIDVI
jgi:hypothetical protein